MTRNFLNISKKECVTASKEVLKNSDKHFELAEKLYLLNENGSAISHTIIGSEELIKALILHLDSIGFNFRQIKGMKGIFDNHQLRYFISFIIFSFSVVSDELKFFIEKIRNKEIGIEQLEEFNRKMKVDDAEFKVKIFTKIISKIEFLLNEINWFSNFDLFRQKGFYVDFENEIKTPLQATEQDYTSIMVRIERVRKTVFEIIDSLNDKSEDNKKLLEDILQKVNNEKVYNSISKFIQNVRLNKTNALDYTLNSVKPFIDDIKQDVYE